ncbi:hypothetical protein [Paenibacillus sacheonensis]|uniref:Uncharacterized protein n=1 Tax=Paenibacillus sacheonensis TaxID=742054 RepID=A0A7X4YRQ2_9BACL|nr:hypothetical protein [Paenibacillus sacheonensis]MBM7567637.1 hypothetical protein [Paenibacillus sacheonensis]NBC71260.1 hypothetical protein [Paenibacillus sacheonensis]
MRMHIKQGWRLTIKHFYIIILLFLYELIWGFFLYRTIEGIAVPLLKRFPDSYAASSSAISLFVTESQFQLMKTDLLQPYAVLFCGLLAGRMIITPFLNAGLFHSLHHATDDKGTTFLKGIRKAWKPVTLLYLLETALTLAPALWLLPRALHLLLASDTLVEFAKAAGPWAGGWLLWAVLLHLFFLSMQFGAVTGSGSMRALWSSMANFLPFAGVSLMMWGIGALLSATVASVSLLWAGLLALVLHQGYQLLRTIMKVWTAAAQYDVWQSKQSS